MTRTGRLNSCSLGIFSGCDLTMGKRYSFRRKQAEQALSVAADCWYSSGRNSRLTSASRMNLPTCYQYIQRKSHFPNICDTGLATLLITGVEKSQIASGRRSVGISH